MESIGDSDFLKKRIKEKDEYIEDVSESCCKENPLLGNGKE